MYPHPCWGEWKKRDFGELKTCPWCLEETDCNMFDIPLDQEYYNISKGFVGQRIWFCSWHCRQQWLKFFKKTFPRVWEIFWESFSSDFQKLLVRMIEEDSDGSKSVIVLSKVERKYYVSELPCGGTGSLC